MLNIYVGKENLPKNIIFVFDVEAAFPLVSVTGDELQRKVLSDVEKGTYLNSKRFVDRFGGQLYYSDMSTGSKAVMAVAALTDKIINCDECGENALRLMSLIDEGNIYLSQRSIGLPWCRDCKVSYNGKVFERISLLNDYEW